MGHLEALIQAYLDEQDRPQSWLAGKMTLPRSTISSWMRRGSRPQPHMLLALASQTGISHVALLAAVDADAGYISEADFEKALTSAKLRPSLRAHLTVKADPTSTRKRRGA
jgi:transcriptional regulator with XRE-family HTH domain